MTTKEKVKKELNTMPDELLEEVYKFITDIKSAKTKKAQIHTFKLNGSFDQLDVREKAYE